MRILLDESLPRQLASEFGDHEVTTVVQRGWAGLGNGELLRRAVAAGFGVLLTGDRNIQYQQNIAKLSIGVVVVAARTNRFEDLLPLVPKWWNSPMAIATEGTVRGKSQGLSSPPTTGN